MKNGSAIVMTGSVTGLLGNKDLLDYSMTKGGIHAFTRSLATHLIDRGHPRECGRAGTGLDAAQSGRQAGGEGGEVRQRHADEASGAARRDRAGFRLPRRAKLLQLHHRRGAPHHRRLFRRLISSGDVQGGGHLARTWTPKRLTYRCLKRVFPLTRRVLRHSQRWSEAQDFASIPDIQIADPGGLRGALLDDSKLGSTTGTPSFRRPSRELEQRELEAAK